MRQVTGAIGSTVSEVITLFEGDGSATFDHLLHDEVELKPPTYGKSWRGKALVGALLRFASSALEDMQYTAVWSGDSEHVLRFEGRVGEEKISGVDIILLDENGLITSFEIFARPPRAVLKLRDAMGERVGANEKIALLMGLSPTAKA